MTKILAIDTSTDACSVALLCDNNDFNRFIVAKQQQTEFILPMVDEILAEAQLVLNQLDAIAFGCGPGSFTGVRLAASVTQGLAFVSNLPVVKISTLRALAQGVFVELGKTSVLVAQDARMHEIYWGEYQVDEFGIMQPIFPDQLIIPEEVKVISDKNFVGVGSGWKIYNDILLKRCSISVIGDEIYPQAKHIAQLASVDFVKGLAVSVENALPVYLREKVAWSSGKN